MYSCFNCQAPWDSSLRQPAVKETCGQCGAYLHCCRNCRFHRKGYPNACYIPDTEKIADKTRANFCDEFEFRRTPVAADEVPPAQDRFSEFWGEDTDTSRNDRDHGVVKEWLLESDTSVKDFDDLFKD